jgi:hypothetical protein
VMAPSAMTCAMRRTPTVYARARPKHGREGRKRRGGA